VVGQEAVVPYGSAHTISEGHVDEIKFAVACLLGAIFLKHLVDKTLRGMQAAILAGRTAGGRVYGYKRVIRLGADGERIRGLIEIDERQALSSGRASNGSPRGSLRSRSPSG